MNEGREVKSFGMLFVCYEFYFGEKNKKSCLLSLHGSHIVTWCFEARTRS